MFWTRPRKATPTTHALQVRALGLALGPTPLTSLALLMAACTPTAGGSDSRSSLTASIAKARAAQGHAGSGSAGAAPAAASSGSATPAPERAPATPAGATATSDDVAPALCPPGMAHVRHDYCPKLERECVKKEYDKPNRITICHQFREGKAECRAPRVPLDYCIDEFEFPNRRGEKPPVMVSFYDAEKSCGELGKRLCLESEWVAACEGPDETPFPYGYARSAEVCNIDNKWVDPSLSRVYSKDPEIQRAELQRLDRSVPSGSRPECKSGYGVFDLTGNVDEWVRADVERKQQRARFAGLKGGAWGHVRNACRPVTTSHPPDFKYYFISFRCCADTLTPDVTSPAGSAAATEPRAAGATEPVGAPVPAEPR